MLVSQTLVLIMCINLHMNYDDAVGKLGILYTDCTSWIINYTIQGTLSYTCSNAIIMMLQKAKNNF